MDVEAVLGVGEDENADVAHAAQVDELAHPVLDEPLVKKRVEQPLD